MEDDEEDYMSDAFLAKCVDTTPGLLWGKNKKSLERDEKHKMANTAQKSIHKPKAILEQEKRDEGLKIQIGEENKGFALMQKMGYKPGMSIGKKGDGIVDPIGIQIKSGRGGLGQESERKRRAAEITSMRAVMNEKRKRMDELGREDYRHRKKFEAKIKQMEKDFYKSQKVCEHLDRQAEYDEPVEPWFWPNLGCTADDDHDTDVSSKQESGHTDGANEEKNEEYKLDIADRMEIITSYLRNTYWYCLWCGTSYDCGEDLNANCPGNTNEEHR